MRPSLTIALGASLLAAPVQAAPAITGKWITDDRTAIVLVAPCAAGSTMLCGWISRFLVTEPAGGLLDAKNPEKSLRTRKLVGVPVLTGLKAQGNEWTGRGYGPKEGRNFNATVKLQNGKLAVRGCVTIICRTVVWTRS